MNAIVTLSYSVDSSVANKIIQMTNHLYSSHPEFSHYQGNASLNLPYDNSKIQQSKFISIVITDANNYTITRVQQALSRNDQKWWLS